MARLEVFAKCSRCGKAVHGAMDIDEKGEIVATSGFYLTGGAWGRFMEKGEVLVCDTDMGCDIRYQAQQGIPHA